MKQQYWPKSRLEKAQVGCKLTTMRHNGAHATATAPAAMSHTFVKFNLCLARRQSGEQTRREKKGKKRRGRGKEADTKVALRVSIGLLCVDKSPVGRKWPENGAQRRIVVLPVRLRVPGVWLAASSALCRLAS